MKSIRMIKIGVIAVILLSCSLGWALEGDYYVDEVGDFGPVSENGGTVGLNKGVMQNLGAAPDRYKFYVPPGTTGITLTFSFANEDNQVYSVSRFGEPPKTNQLPQGFEKGDKYSLQESFSGDIYAEGSYIRVISQMLWGGSTVPFTGWLYVDLHGPGTLYYIKYTVVFRESEYTPWYQSISWDELDDGGSTYVPPENIDDDEAEDEDKEEVKNPTHDYSKCPPQNPFGPYPDYCFSDDTDDDSEPVDETPSDEDNGDETDDTPDPTPVEQTRIQLQDLLSDPQSTINQTNAEFPACFQIELSGLTDGDSVEKFAFIRINTAYYMAVKDFFFDKVAYIPYSANDRIRNYGVEKLRNTNGVWTCDLFEKTHEDFYLPDDFVTQHEVDIFSCLIPPGDLEAGVTDRANCVKVMIGPAANH